MGNLFKKLNDPGTTPAFYLFDKKGEKTVVSFQQFASDIQHFIFVLSEKITSLKGAHIAVIAHSSYHYIVCMYAIIGAGAVFVPLNIEKSQRELCSEIDKADINYIVHDGACCEMEQILCSQYAGKLIDIQEYRNVSDSRGWEEREPDELSIILFTSGTTDSSKGVAVPYRAVETNAAATAWVLTEIRERSNMGEMNGFFCIPLYHTYGISSAMGCLFAGFTLSLCSDRKNILRDIVLSQANFTAMVPVMLKSLGRFLENGHPEKLGQLKEIVSAGALCQPEIYDNYLKYGIHIRNIYGLTEYTYCSVNFTDDYYRKTHSVGRPYGDTQLSISEGEILLKGSSLMKGYYNDAEATSDAIRDGWFHTGDLGYLDEEGYLYLTGRLKNVIILSSGENVSPEELEGYLLRNEAIKETVVKEKNGRICAEIFCEASDQDRIRDFVQEVNREIALYKRITWIEFRSTPFPKTGNGKIKRI